MVIKTRSDRETQNLGEKLGRTVKSGFFCLYGELGAGKTTFVRGLAKGLGISGRVQSPTFTYQRIYRNRLNRRSRREKKLYHFDFYRLSKPDPLLIQELYEAVERRDGIIAIEWAERIEEFLPKERTDIFFTHVDEKTRNIKLP